MPKLLQAYDNHSANINISDDVMMMMMNYHRFHVDDLISKTSELWGNGESKGRNKKPNTFNKAVDN